MVVRRVIMCRTRPVLEFDYDVTSGKAVGSGKILDLQRLPLELIAHGKPAVYASRIDAWWRDRAIPSTRDGIHTVLQVLGLPSTTALLNRSRGLSLSDQYWVKDADSDERWEDVNFFHNPFDEELGHTLLTSFSSSRDVDFDVPDSSTGGDLPKRWTVLPDGRRALVKAGRSQQEPVNEVIADGLCARLGIEAVPYWLGEQDNRLVSLCADMLGDREELVSAWPLLQSVKERNGLSAKDQWLEAAQSFGCPTESIQRATDDWLVIDWLMRNVDRHYNNFGLIRDIETLEIRPAPIFDTGTSLWTGELHVDNRDYYARPFYRALNKPTARRQLGLVSDWSRYDFDALAGWPEEVADILVCQAALSASRADAIGDALKTKIETAKRYQA